MMLTEVFQELNSLLVQQRSHDLFAFHLDVVPLEEYANCMIELQCLQDLAEATEAGVALLVPAEDHWHSSLVNLCVDKDSVYHCYWQIQAVIQL